MHTSDLMGIDRIAVGFFCALRPRARPEDVGFGRDAKRDALVVSRLLLFGRTKSGRCARVLVAVGLFSIFFSLLRSR